MTILGGPAAGRAFTETCSVLDAIQELGAERARGVTFVAARERRQASYAELVARMSRVASGLRERGLRAGDAVAVVLPDPEEAIVAIVGAMAAGVAPAPMYPPAALGAVPRFLEHLEHVVDRADARLVVASTNLVPLLGSAPRPVETLATLLQSSPGPFEQRGFDDVAFHQFTSGTTTAPRGVPITHGRLAANIQMIREATRMDGTSKVVTWLPVYHDMGLIGAVLNAVSLGIDLSVLAPQVFLKSPRLWLEEITRVGGTHAGAPNFACGLCVKRIRDVSGLDLSSMRVLICGAEPVLPATIERFTDHFAPAGLDARVMTPAYGLAEATLAVTIAPYGRGLRCDDSVVPRTPSCGPALPGLDVRVVGEDGRVCRDRVVGEIQVRGMTVMAGYVNDEELTRRSFAPGGWLRTGDLGYLAGGELHVLGRSKDVVIVRGRNLYAHELEAVAGEHPDVRTGSVAAFGVPVGDTEGVVVVAESRRPREEADRIARELRSRIRQVFGVGPEDVRIVPPGTIPKTSSGKLQRGETRERYRNDGLRPRGRRTRAAAAVVKSVLGHLTGKAR
jgi:acyl-CoA synthetase (AMP-forming)/AMP-acid ligase II